jgi:hypothetical protein
MNFLSSLKIHLKQIEKYLFKPTFWLEKLMKLLCNKLRNEDQHMFQQVIKKNLFPFCKNLLDTYLKLKAHNEK